jgi:hypothetical protein
VNVAQRVFGRILFELLNRSRRIRQYLLEVGPGESNEFAQLSRTIITALDQFESTAISAVKQTRLDTIDVPDQKVLLGALDVFSRAFSTIHEYLTYFPPLPIRSETIQALRAVFGKEFSRHEPSILLTSSFNAFEFDFVRQLTSSLSALQVLKAPTERNIVLQLPSVDVATPTAWPLLAHEVGHAIDAENEISAKIAERLAPGTNRGVRLLIQDLCEELTADLIAARAVGPAAPLALLSFVYCLLPQERVEWDPTPRLSGRSERVYPATRWRARVTYDYISQRTVGLQALQTEVTHFEEAWRFRAELVLGKERAVAAEENEKRVYDRLISTLVSEIVQQVDDLPIRDYSLENEDLGRHVRRLAQGLPIGAQGQARPALVQIVETYRQTAKPSRADFDALVRRFEERPTGVSAILFSGFLHRGNLIIDLSTKPGTISHSSTSALVEALDRSDALLRTSIESSEIHQDLLDRRRANELAALAITTSGAITLSPATVDEFGSPHRPEQTLLADIQILSRLVEQDDLKLLFVAL